MLVSLWQSDNDTPDSSVFTVRPGNAAILVATGFALKRTRTDPAEMESPQFACLHHLLFVDKNSRILALEPCSACDYVYDIIATDVSAYDEPVYVNGQPWGLSKCNNTMLWALPGTYYLHLNDTTGIGKAQVWIEIIGIEKLPLSVLGDFTGVCHG